jgi:hypothetical protein
MRRLTPIFLCFKQLIISIFISLLACSTIKVFKDSFVCMDAKVKNYSYICRLFKD